MSGRKRKSSGDVAGITVLFKVLYCKIKNVFFFVCLFMYCLCEKYYKPITVQYYIANCVRFANFVGLTNKLYLGALGTELVRM